MTTTLSNTEYHWRDPNNPPQPNNPSQQPNLLTLPTEILFLILSHLRPTTTTTPTQQIVVWGYGVHGFSYRSDRCEDLRSQARILAHTSPRLGDVAREVLKREEALEEAILEACRREARRVVEVGVDWSCVPYVMDRWVKKQPRWVWTVECDGRG